jgi:hypothetical protein
MGCGIVRDQKESFPWVKANIPTSAEWVVVHSADLDGDGIAETIVIYREKGQNWLLIMNKKSGEWKEAARVKGNGYQVSAVYAAPVTKRQPNNLLIGWQTGAVWSTLSIYEWKNGILVDVAPKDVSFSYMDVADMPDQQGRKDGLAEIALWSHDTGEAYNVEVYRWHDGKLVPAPDVYPYYFRTKVVPYYEKKVKEHPDYTFYQKHLADAKMKAGLVPLEGWEDGERGMIREQLRAITLFPASVKSIGGTMWGYIDNNGSLVLSADYDYANNFQDNGLAIVERHDNTGAINTMGRYVVKPVYDSISPFTEGRAIAIDKAGFKVIDETGSVLTRKAYEYISRFSGGMAVFNVSLDHGSGQLYGYLDRQGREAIPPQYMEAGDFSKDGRAVVKVKDNEYALIDRTGKKLHTYPYAYVGSLGDGLLPFRQEESGKTGYIDEMGKIVIQPSYSMALPFQNGRAVVNLSSDIANEYGLINRKGQFILQPIYNDVHEMGEERVAVGKAVDPEKPYLGSNFAIADLNGTFLSDFVYTGVEDYRNGIASVSDGQSTFFIDRSGKPAPGLPKVEGNGTLTMMDSVIQANVNQRISYLDRSGKVIWRQNTVIPLASSYRVIEMTYKPNKDYLVYYPAVDGMANKSAQRRVNDKLKKMSEVKPVGSGQLEYTYTGDFNVTYFRKQLLALELNGYNYPFGAAHGMPTRVYAHVDLVSGKFYSLEDLFKKNSKYVQELSRIVGEQIKNDPQYSYVFPDSYKGIKPDQPFYVTTDALYLYFNPYDIGPYAAGFPTFKIPFSQIMNMINTKGEFWKSFH